VKRLPTDKISLMQTISSYKKVGGKKWYDEALKSFGAYFLFKQIFNSDSSLIHGFSELSGKSYSTFKKELKEQAIVAEQILAKHQGRPNPREVFSNFKSVVFERLSLETPNIYNKYEFMSNEHTRPKQEGFTNE
jgi:hypothetical protein